MLFPPETFCLRAIMKHTHTCGNQDITSRFAFRINRSSFVVSFHHPVTLWRSIVSQHQTIFQRSRTFWECACPRPALSSIPSIWRKFGLGRVWRTSKAFRIFELLWSLLVTSVLSVVSCVFFSFHFMCVFSYVCMRTEDSCGRLGCVCLQIITFLIFLTPIFLWPFNSWFLLLCFVEFVMFIFVMHIECISNSHRTLFVTHA